jgi:hypothetical protein
MAAKVGHHSSQSANWRTLSKRATGSRRLVNERSGHGPDLRGFFPPGGFPDVAAVHGGGARKQPASGTALAEPSCSTAHRGESRRAVVLVSPPWGFTESRRAHQPAVGKHGFSSRRALPVFFFFFLFYPCFLLGHKSWPRYGIGEPWGTRFP